MKEQILQLCYTKFEDWAGRYTFSCNKGCSACCTRNVTITALEGESIIDHCIAQEKGEWLAGKLNGLQPLPKLLQTTNEYVGVALEGKDQEDLVQPGGEVCPFLENNLCSIYSVRPFSCRCFASQVTCSTRQAAIVDEEHLYGSIVVMQLLEHLGQFEYWGYLSDVLLALSDKASYHDFSHFLDNTTQIVQARYALRTAQPIPGFIIPDERQESVNTLLNSIFTSRIGSKTIEQILNGQ